MIRSFIIATFTSCTHAVQHFRAAQAPPGIQWDAPDGVWRPAEQAAEDSFNVCQDGKQLPDLYVLGVQKCGTSSLARALAGAGVQIAHSPDNAKELHFFNMPIKVDFSLDWEADNGRPWKEYKEEAKLLPMIKWEGSSLEENRKMWHEYYMPTCPQGQRTVLADFTPDYVRIVPKGEDVGRLYDFWRPVDLMNVSLPKFMKSMYGEASKKVTFAIMIREPLAQLQSAWYMSLRSNFIYCRSCKGESFNATLEQHMKQLKNKDLTEWLWTVMYARQIEEWLTHFDASQFYIIPMHVLAKGDNKNICREFARRLHFRMDCHGGEMTQTFGGTHPTMEEDVGPEDSAIRTKFSAVMDVENERLVRLLSKAYAKGLSLANYEGLGDENSVRSWLLSGW